MSISWYFKVVPFIILPFECYPNYFFSSPLRGYLRLLVNCPIILYDAQVFWITQSFCLLGQWIVSVGLELPLVFFFSKYWWLGMISDTGYKLDWALMTTQVGSFSRYTFLIKRIVTPMISWCILVWKI